LHDTWLNFWAVSDWLAWRPRFGWGFDTAAGALAALWLILCTFLLALRIARWALPNTSIVLRWSNTCAIGMGVSTLGFHCLRSLHAFRLGYALVACSALWLIVDRRLPGRLPALQLLRREWRALRAICRAFKRSSSVIISAWFIGAGALTALRGLVIPPLGWDTLTYHGPRAALWLTTQQFTFDDGVGSFDYYRHFFAGGEIFLAWALLPFHSDLLLNLVSVAQWLALFVASWALARAIGLREPFAATSAAVVIFAPTPQFEVNSGYVELALNAALLQGIALAVHCMRRPSVAGALLCALALGVAAGIKLQAIPPAAVVALVLLGRLLLTRELRPRQKLFAAGSGMLLALLPALPFIGRALLDTGYPLSPFPVSLFGHKLGIASSTVRWYQDRPQIAPFTWPSEMRALGVLFSPPAASNEALGSLFAIPLLLFPIGLFALFRRAPVLALALLTAAALPWVAHFSPDFSAVRLLRPVTPSRFLIASLALVVPISLVWCRRDGWLSRAYRRLLLIYPLTTTVIGMRRGWGDWEVREICTLAIALALIGSLIGWLVRRQRLQAATLAFVLCWLLGLCVLQMRRDETRELAFTESFALHGISHFWDHGVALVDEPGRVHRIAITGGPDHSSDKWFHYFYFGSRFQNRLHYITPTRDGGVAQFGPDGDLEERADMPSWIARLRAAGIDTVLTFPPRSIEQRYMDDHPDQFERRKGNKDWGLYGLLAEP
jgi:hypothetical protein